ncbi:hypothetical protein [Edwardsiella ictaluri]|uniref:hypothetical protein n=1 Tax=Edwardsiella ictaluri TaxID=67780 RepID=UPI0018DE4201|nr:hypothetical protein [Edwardsiella ictaluri]QPW30533.1 hypothetical protein F8539_11630 [Edwardsiella ictaluri]
MHKVETPSSQSLSRVPSISKLTNESLGKLTNRRDVVLINPICGGSGDISLANKIANLALEQDCRITIVPVDCTLFGDPTFNNNHRNISHCSVEHSIGDFYDPIFVVAPAAICSPAKLHDIIESLCHEYHLNKDDVACIEEMDFISPDNARVLEREDMFKKSGFNKSMYYSLGFSEGAIGYLPVDKHTVDIVRERCERDLVNLLDSYNFSLEKQSRYNIAYISSPNIYNAVRVFVTNTLSENQSGNANYIIVVRLLNEKNEDKLIKYTEGVLSHGGDDYNPQDLFSSANIYVAKPDDAEKQTIHHKVNVDGVRRR